MECKICGKILDKTKECAWTSCPLLFEEEDWDEERIDIIGSNGNDGTIYHWKHKHGHRPKGGSSPTYSSWKSMKDRCKTKEYYIKNNITVCDRWKEFVYFLADMGEKPEGYTIDRIDNTKGYYKENCRWASQSQQSRNRKNNITTTINNITKCLVDFAREYGIPTTTIYRRYHNGLRGEELIAPALHSTKEHYE